MSRHPYASSSSSSSPSHRAAAPHLALSLHDMQLQHHHSSSPPFASAHLAHPIPAHAYAPPPPLSPALYTDSSSLPPQPSSATAAMTLDPSTTPTHDPLALDSGSGHGGWGGMHHDTRLRSMSSDSALVDHFLNPIRGVSLDMGGGYFPSGGGGGGGGYHGGGGGGVSPAPMGNGVEGVGVEGAWQGSVMYPPNSHTPTLSTASIGAAYALPPSSFYANQTPTRGYHAAPLAAVYPSPAQPVPTRSAFPTPPPSRSIIDHSPPTSSSFPSPSCVPPPSSTSSPSALSHRQVSPITVKPPPSNPLHSLLPLTIQLRSGTGKKKIWPNRTVHSSPTWSFSQLLFHAANLSTFLAVAVEGEAMPSDARLRDAKAIDDLLSSSSSLDPSSSSYPSPSTKVEVVFDLPANVKSCTRLGCPNLLVNKANRRACNVCQSQGADLFPGQVRLVHAPYVLPGGGGGGGGGGTSSAYLDLYLDQFEHWKFDGAEEGLQYIVFTDEATAQRVQNEMSSNLHMHHTQHMEPTPSSPSSSSLLQPVDPSLSYTIRMKSHFWMLQVRPLDPNAGASRTKLYKKVGKPNQSRTADKSAMKGEKDNNGGGGDDPTPSKSKGGGGGGAAPEPSLHPHAPHHHEHRHLPHQLGNHSPVSTESEGSSEHSYPSLPPLGPHHQAFPPSSPSSYSTDSSSALSSPPHPHLPPPTHQRKRGRHTDADDGALFIDEGEGGGGGRRSNSVSTDSSSSHDPTSSPDPFPFDKGGQAGMGGVGVEGDNRLFVSDAAFMVMKQNKPVPAMMNVGSGQPLMVGTAMTAGGEGGSEGGGGGGGVTGAEGSLVQPALAATGGVGARCTPVVLVYRDVEAYERERRRMRKEPSKGGDRDKGGRWGGGGGGGGGGEGRGGGGGGGGGGGDDRGRREEESKGDKDDDSSASRKRGRYYDAPGSGGGGAGGQGQPRQYAMGKGVAVSPRKVAVGKGVLPELKQSLLGDTDVKDSALEMAEYSGSDDGGSGDKTGAGKDRYDYGIDVLRGAGEQRMVLPVQLAELLQDRERMETFFQQLKEQPVFPASSATTAKLFAKDRYVRELQSLQSTSLCTYFTMAFGVLSLVLLIIFATGIADSSPLFYIDAPPSQSPQRQQILNVQSKSILSSMESISPVFAAWASGAGTAPLSNSTKSDDPPPLPNRGGGGGGGGNGANGEILNRTSPQVLVEMCVDAQRVAKAMGDWLLYTQGLLEVYRNFGTQEIAAASTSANATCENVRGDVGYAHLRSLVCSPLNFKVHGAHVARYKMCQAGKGVADFTPSECQSMLTDLHASNLTATVLLGLLVDDVNASQYQVVDSLAGGGSVSAQQWSVTQYLRTSRPEVRVVEMSAFGYYGQAQTLASACALFSVVNQLSLDYSQPPDKAAGPRMEESDGSSKMMHPLMMLLILLGSSGLFMIIQVLLLSVGRVAQSAYARIKQV